MGEIADMMLDGTMCQSCGEWMDDGGDGPGYPVTCEGCKSSQMTYEKPKSRKHKNRK